MVQRWIERNKSAASTLVRVRRGRRFGGVPPIVTVLITIAAVVAASLVAWFMWTSTRGATQQVVLEVTGAYISVTGATTALTFTVKNVGALQIANAPTLYEVQCEQPAGGNPISHSSTQGCTWSSATQMGSCRATFNAALQDGARCFARLNAGGRSVTVTFRVVKP